MVFPAPAGINRSLLAAWANAGCVPRASGDKPFSGRTATYQDRVFPAPAGINLFRRKYYRNGARVPRASGDKPRTEKPFSASVRCSPRQRE